MVLDSRARNWCLPFNSQPRLDLNLHKGSGLWCTNLAPGEEVKRNSYINGPGSADE